MKKVNTKAKYLIKDVDFSNEDAHLAYTLGKGAASGMNDAYILKSEENEKLTDEEREEMIILSKGMTYNNRRKQLQAALDAMLEKAENSTMGSPKSYYAYVEDFSDNEMIYCMNDKVYKTPYAMVDDKVSLMKEDTVEVVMEQNYVPVNKSSEGDALSASDNIGADTGHNTEGKTMKDMTPEQIEKSVEDRAQALLKSMEADLKKQWEAENAVAELEKSNTALLKGMDFVSEDALEVIVKATLVEGGDLILKTLEQAGEAIKVAKAAEEKAVTDLDKFKEEFSKPEAVEGTVKEDLEKSFDELKAEAVAFHKAKQNK